MDASGGGRDDGVVLGQVRTAEKSNEITAIPGLLDLLDIRGCIVTIDAMGCQKAMAEKIREKRGHYVLAVKEIRASYWKISGTILKRMWDRVIAA